MTACNAVLRCRWADAQRQTCGADQPAISRSTSHFLGFGSVLSAFFFFPNKACVCNVFDRLPCTACRRSFVLLKADCIAKLSAVSMRRGRDARRV
jgi:hypothetical protein